jgi:Zn-dependent protease
VPDINIGDAILWFVVFVFSLTLHEVGHAWTSELFGDDTGRYLGRISLNPMVHIDPIGTVLLPIMSMFSGIPLFGWAKPVPVNPLNWRNKTKANIAVSAAGPLANVLIAVVSIIAIKLLLISGDLIFTGRGLWHFVDATNQDGLMVPISTLLCIALTTNVGLAVFNMIPIPPLDGSHILSSILSLVSQDLMDFYENLRPYGFMILMVLMFTGIFGVIYMPVLRTVLMFLVS